MSRSRLAEQVGAGRELVVLADGPWRARWYWADELGGSRKPPAASHPKTHPGSCRATNRAPIEGATPTS